MGKHLTTWERGEIEQMKKEGKTNAEIGERMGYSKTRICDYFQGIRKKALAVANGKPPKTKGRPRKSPISPHLENELRIKELERENELLRSFLHAAGRR